MLKKHCGGGENHPAKARSFSEVYWKTVFFFPSCSIKRKKERKKKKCCNFLCHSTCSGRSDQDHCFTFPSAPTARSIQGPDFRSPSAREAGGEAARPRAQRASWHPDPPGRPPQEGRDSSGEGRSPVRAQRTSACSHHPVLPA